MDQIQESYIGYILKGYPRIDDAFITNEIYLLESMGIKLHIFSLNKLDRTKRHANVDRIKATITYLPKVKPITNSKFLNRLQRFYRSHIRLFRWRPFSYLRTLLYAFHLSLKCRSGSLPQSQITKEKEEFFKDFLRAGYIALKVLESGRIRHLHGHFCHAPTTTAIFVSQLTGIPFSFTAHAKDVYLPQLNPGDLLQRKIRKAQFVVTCTDANRAYLTQLCPEVTTIRTIYHGVDTALFAPPEYRGDYKKMPIILSVGRFVEKKGFACLVNACRLLKDKGRTFQCQIVASADEQSHRIIHLITQLGLEDTVSLKGAVTHQELTEIYKQCTVFCLPCLIAENGDRDGIPNVLMEAMAMEVPVVSTNISGIPELIDHRVNGLLVPQKDASALAGALEELLEDPDLRRKLGKAAHEKVCESFDATKTTVLLKALFLPYLEMKEEVSG